MIILLTQTADAYTTATLTGKIYQELYLDSDRDGTSTTLTEQRVEQFSAVRELNDLDDVDAGSPADGQALTWDDAAQRWAPQTPAGGGDVSGPGSATDRALARWSGTGGDALLNSGAVLDDSGNLTLPGSIAIGATTATISGKHIMYFDPASSEPNSVYVMNGNPQGTLGLFRPTSVALTLTQNDMSGVGNITGLKHGAASQLVWNLIGYNSSGAGPQLTFNQNRGTFEPFAPENSQNGDTVGEIRFEGRGGGVHAASIYCRVDGEPASSGDATDFPARLDIELAVDGESPSQRIRITGDGTINTSGSLNAAGAATITGSLTVDGGTLAVNATGNNVGIGMTPVSSIALAVAQSNTDGRIRVYAFDDGSGDPRLELAKSDTDTVGTLSQTDNGDELGAVYFLGVNSGSSLYSGARIEAVQNGTAGASFVPADLRFYTATTAAAVNAMSLKSDMQVVLGATIASDSSFDQYTEAHLYDNGSGAHLTFDGTWADASLERFKTDFQDVSTSEMLALVLAIPARSWEYRVSRTVYELTDGTTTTVYPQRLEVARAEAVEQFEQTEYEVMLTTRTVRRLDERTGRVVGREVPVETRVPVRTAAAFRLRDGFEFDEVSGLFYESAEHQVTREFVERPLVGTGKRRIGATEEDFDALGISFDAGGGRDVAYLALYAVQELELRNRGLQVQVDALAARVQVLEVRGGGR